MSVCVSVCVCVRACVGACKSKERVNQIGEPNNLGNQIGKLHGLKQKGEYV